MADDSAIANESISSPESHAKTSRRERRKSGLEASTTPNVIEAENVARAKKGPSQHRPPKISIFPEVREEATDLCSEAGHVSVRSENPQGDSQQEAGPTFRHPRLPQQTDGETDSSSTQDLNITLHDISQSKWIENPNDHSTEKVYLTIEEAPLTEMVTIAPSAFCWIHHKRTPQVMQFEDFGHILDNSPGLYQHEYDAAKKVLEEVKHMRHVFAKGKYFDPVVHQVKDSPEVAGQKTEVKATFISIPIFSSMRNQEPMFKHYHDYGFMRRPFQHLFERTHRLVHEEEYSKNRHRHLASKDLRSRNGHPIRTLMQQANILAVDNSRDLQQAAIRLEDDGSPHTPFIHVPEFWALVINMYTIITCAPFTVEQLQGENIIFRPPPKKDRRAMVKYTSLNGAPHEFRCRTWVGLLDIISRIEKQIDQSEELGVLLQKGESEYKLIDGKFRSIDRKRWIRLTEADVPTPRSVIVRLVKVSKEDILDVGYSERKFWTDRGLAWDLVSFHIKLERVRRDLSDARRRHAPSKEMKALESTLSALRLQYRETRTRRIAQRFSLLAVRYHLIDPAGLLFDENEAYLAAIHSRRSFRREDSSFSGSLRDDRSRSPGLSRHPTGNPSIDQTVRPKRPSVDDTTGITGVQMPANPEIGKRDTETAQKVIDRFEAPKRRRIGRDATVLLAIDEKSLQLPQISADKIQARFQAPRRSVTSQSLVRVQERGPRIERARTVGPKFDLEAQTQSTKKTARVVFALDSLDAPIIPTYIIKGSKDKSEPRGHHPVSGPRKSQTPYIFQQHTPTIKALPPGSLAVAPLRLPPLAGDTEIPPRHAGQKPPQSRSSSPPSDRRHMLEICRGDQGAPEVAAATKAGTSVQSGVTAPRLTFNRRIKGIKQLQPFFQWRGASAAEAFTPRTSRPSNTHWDGLLPNGSPSMDVGRVPGEKLAEDVLEILEIEMRDRYLISEEFAIQPHHYEDIEEKTICQVQDAFDKTFRRAGFQSQTKHPTEAQKFWDTKLSIFLKVDTILSCFVGNTELESALIKKAWGVVFNICQLSLEDVKSTAASFPHCNHKPLAWANRELGRIEQMCQEVLVSVRSDTGNRVEQMDFPLPPSFRSLFRDIMVFLLSIPLLARDPKNYTTAADQCRKAVEEDLGECETALLRAARESQSHGDQDEYMHESLKTADTLLSLLLQNAFSLSCSDKIDDDPDNPRHDLEHIYRRWTAVCHERAVREASAEMYEEVRLLREELSVIIDIYEAQKQVFDKTLQLRESPKQRLDIRINKRTEAFLDDMIKHFKTLKDYAKEAETLTTNYIRVSNEDNSKAIFVFTTVTVIFLPLNFVSSVLGMNVSDIRATKRGSSLFWEIAVPVTLAVVTLCLLLVKIKFKFTQVLRRRCARVLLKFFPKD